MNFVSLTKLAVFSLLLILSVTTHAAGISVPYDVAADWSDASNPNGVWTYEVNGSPGTSGTRTGDTFGIAPPIWGSGGDTFVGWSQSNGTEMFPHSWSGGQVFGHSPSSAGSISIAWTSPTDGTAVIAGTIAEGRAIGRSNSWTLTLNGVSLGGIGGTLNDLNQSDSFSTIASISAGDILSIEVSALGSGDYVFFQDYTIDLQPVPVPAAVWLFGTGILSLFGFARRRALN